jgi:hypothetical protein
MPVPLHRLSRRLALGLFLDIWPGWALGSLLIGGSAALLCRLFLPDAARWLPWCWLAPLISVVPAVVQTWRRAYTPTQVATLADVLSGGAGLLLSSTERQAEAWHQAPALVRARAMTLPPLRFWPRLRLILPGVLFLAIALLLPQRVSVDGGRADLGTHVVEDLATTVEELKAQALLTPEEEQRLEDEIEAIRKDAEDRVDAAAWEAADAMRERMTADLAKKLDAAQWAEESLSRYAAAASGGAAPGGSPPDAGELHAALKALEQSGLLANAPEELRQLASGGARLPIDPAALRRLQEALAAHLGSRTARLARGFGEGRGGRFDPGEFPLAEGDGRGGRDGRGRGDGTGDRPGPGGVTRGRADAALTWGQETQPFDRFRARALPPGFARSPDDFAPGVELPGAPDVSPDARRGGASRSYDATAGQEAWRRTLAPRHQSAVRKYFEVRP